MDRRKFLVFGASVVGATGLAELVPGRSSVKVILFDAFPVYDPGVWR
ncbi:hypothetical protein ACQ86N_29995 [Puia sp. P3]